MFGLKLFLNEALEGFWSGARKQKSDGETPGSIRAGTVPAVSKPFIKPRHSKISIDINRLYMCTLKEIKSLHPACSHGIREISTFWFHIPFGLRPRGIWNQNVDISRIP